MMKTRLTVMAWVGGFSVVTMLAASPARGQTYRLASHKAVDGFKKIVLTDGSLLYVGGAVTPAVTSRVTRTNARDQARSASALSLSSGSAAQLAINIQQTGANLIVTERAQGLTEVAEIDSVGVNTVTLRNTRSVQPIVESATALVTLTPRASTLAPGDAVEVDVFVSGVDRLQTFQFAVEAGGGTSGSLERLEASIARERADYVFADIQAIDAADQNHGRLGATTLGGSVDAMDTHYVGSFAFLASRDASGAFTFSVRPKLSFLVDNHARDVSYRTQVTPVRVTLTKTARSSR